MLLFGASGGICSIQSQLHAFCCITLSCWTFLQLKLWQWPYHSVLFYLAATVLILTLSSLPCGFLAVSYLVISTTVGKSFDANSVYPTDLPLLFPSLNIFFGMLSIGYPCIKLVEYHYPGFCFAMVFRSKRLRYIYFSCWCNRKFTLFYLCSTWNGLWLEITH